MTDNIEDRARAALEGVTPGEWHGYNMVHADRGDQMTPEEIGEYVCNAVKLGDPSRFLFVGGNNDDGHDVDVCHVGNGPRGPNNTRFIAWARNNLPAMADEIERLRAENAALRAQVEGLSADNARVREIVDARDLKVARLRTKLAEALEAMKCARAVFDTPISLRRLGIDPNADERLQVFRATLARMEENHG